MQSSLHLKYLDLSHNQFGERGGEILGPAIGMCYTHTCACHTSAVTCVNQPVGDCESIQTLNLSWNHLRRKGAEAVAEGMKVS